MTVRVAIEDDTQVGEARRTAATLARRAALPEEQAGRLAIVVNELGSNLRKHAGKGELLFNELLEGRRTGVEVLSIDRGKGMHLPESLQDGRSTAGTRGEGLGAVRRLSGEFDAWSFPEKGAVVLSRLWSDGRGAEGALQLSGVCLPLASEQQSGDAWEAQQLSPALWRVLLVDGLGHGPLAARAADEAQRAFRQTQGKAGPEAILHDLHAALRSTRGAALAVTELDLVTRTLRHGGIGNISATVETPGQKARGLLSHSGIAGQEARRLQELTFPFPARSVLVLHSDGLATQWKLEAYRGAQSCHAAVLAGLLYRDFRRPNDDSTVVVIKEP